MNNILVSVIIPCRNEEKFIHYCLDSIVFQSYPKDKLEVLVVDGMSEDKTREMVKDYSLKHVFVKLLDNPEKTTPYALNIGIKNAKGSIVMKMDAHTIYDKEYISQCVFNLEKYKVDNVGGVLEAVPFKNTLVARAIAKSLGSRFGVGSCFKLGTQKPKKVDAVAFGCFRKALFSKIGYYNTNMIRSQDIELNSRIKKQGGKIVLVPEIKAYYYPSPDIKSFFRHNLKDGLWVFYPLKFSIRAFSFRHLIPFFFIFSIISLVLLSFFFRFFLWILALEIILYFLSSFYFSAVICKKEKDIRFFFLLPLIFLARHTGYGLGSIAGLIWIFASKKKQASTIK